MASDNGIDKRMQEYKDKPIPDAVIGAAKQLSTKAAAMAGDQIGKVADLTEKNVRKYPLAAVGIALGSGVVLGTLGTLLFTPKRPTMADRFADLDLGARLMKLYNKYF